MSAEAPGVPAGAGPVGPWSYPRRVLTRPEKYERLAFTFCRMGTIGLIAWVVGPAVFVLVVALVAVALVAPGLSAKDPLVSDVEHGLSALGAPLPPSSDAVLGTDQLGQIGRAHV